jgi:hypothetical protein
MIESKIITKEINLLLIAGAARSGTTVLSNLLDSHSKIICFPMEDNVLDCYYRKNLRNKSFYLNEFINNRTYGQQTIIFNKNLLDSYKKRIQTIYGKKFDLDIDFEKARDGYVSYLKSNDLSVETIYKALALAVLDGCKNYTKTKFDVKYFCFKRPSWVDVYLQNVLKEIDKLKCLWIIRNPKDRYVSAKTRRIKSHKKLSHINRYDYVLGHALVDLMSQDLLLKNKSKKNVYEIDFKSLIKDTETTFDAIFSFLNIPKERCFDFATRLGEPAESGSFTSKVKKGEIDKTVISKREKYLKITSWNERIIHSYFLRRNFLKNDFKKIFISIIYLIPLKHGSLKNYFCQIATIYILWSMSNLLIENFQNDFLNDKVHLSGEI